MAAPLGNKNGAKGKRWEEALRTALARSQGTVDAGLAPIADKVVHLAASGDLEAIREIACRLDGKPTEHVHIEQELTVHAGDADTISPKLDRALASRQKPSIQ